MIAQVYHDVKPRFLLLQQDLDCSGCEALCCCSDNSSKGAQDTSVISVSTFSPCLEQRCSKGQQRLSPSGVRCLSGTCRGCQQVV
jgi:hypothetical protein